MSDTVSCDRQGQGSVQVLMDDDFASGHGGAPLGTLDLHDSMAQSNGLLRIEKQTTIGRPTEKLRLVSV